MSYDLMVFHYEKAPCELGPLQQWFRTHMENDVLPDKVPEIFSKFLESISKLFPPINHCPEDRLEDACEYEIHEDFIYLCFAYSMAKEAHDIVKRQAKIDHLGFWDVSQSFDRTYPVTLPADKWPMIVEAKWLKYGQQFVYHYKEIKKILMQMKTIEQSSVCLTNRYGDYIQAGGYQDRFIVEVRKYIDATSYRHMRADINACITEENLDTDIFVSVNDWKLRVSKSQVLSKNQVCLLFQEFVDEMELNDSNIFRKELQI